MSQWEALGLSGHLSLCRGAWLAPQGVGSELPRGCREEAQQDQGPGASEDGGGTRRSQQCQLNHKRNSKTQMLPWSTAQEFSENPNSAATLHGHVCISRESQLEESELNERNVPFWRRAKDEATLWARKELQKIQRTRQVASTGQCTTSNVVLLLRGGGKSTRSCLLVSAQTLREGKQMD